MSDKSEIIEDVRNLLEYAKSLGMTEVSVKQTRTEKQTTPNTQRTTQIAQLNTKGNGDMNNATALDKLHGKIGDCKRCKLCTGRTKLVFGDGNPNADIMFVGEGPGRDEDMQGIPFVGRAGKLLPKIIEAMKWKRDNTKI